MAGRGVKCSRWWCNYWCGGRHAHTHTVVCPCPPLFIHACTHCHLSAPLPAIIDQFLAYPCSCSLALVHTHCCLFMLISVLLLVPVCPRSIALAGPCAYRCLIMPFATCLCLSPFVCWSPFVPTHLCPLGCAGSVVLVPASLSPLPGCTCLAFTCACWCLLGFICAGSAFVSTRLGFIVPIYALMGFFWAPKPLVCVCIKYVRT